MTLKSLPTDGELEILRVLWRLGPATVRQVHDRLPRGGEVSYNTVGKLLQIMEGKGLVVRDTGSRAHVFLARAEREETQEGLIEDLARRAFGGSAAALALRALKDEELSLEDIRELKALLAESEG